MDKDILREAVEYAEGWEYKGNATTMAGSTKPFVSTPIGFLCVSWDSFVTTPAYLAALASQLVSQVDALDKVHYETGGVGQVNIWEENKPFHERIKIEGPNRDENTITACVEFFRSRKDG